MKYMIVNKHFNLCKSLYSSSNVNTFVLFTFQILLFDTFVKFYFKILLNILYL